MSTQLVKRGPVEVGAADVASVTNRVALIQQVYKNIMQPDVHYGVIPGTPKPSLWKPGAEVVLMALNAAATFPQERVFRVLEKDFVMYEITAAVKSNGSQEIIAEGIGLCSSREEKYAYRKGAIVCPYCGRAAIIKGQEQYGGGWLCYKKKGGCGKKWTAPDAFDSTQAEKQPNPNIWEQANTILKMAEKRALVAAVLNLGASDIFTQDIEDFVDVPNQAGWNGSGSREAAQAVAAEHLSTAELTDDCVWCGRPLPPGEECPCGRVMDQPLPPASPQAVESPSVAANAPQGTPRPAADPRSGKYLYPEQAEDLKRFAKAKKSIGEVAYRRCLAVWHLNKSLEVPDHHGANLILQAMTDTAQAQAAQRKLQAEKAAAEVNANSLYCHRDGSGCSIPVANQIATIIKALKTPWTEANMAMETTFKDRRREFPDADLQDHWNVILLGLEDVLRKKGSAK